MNLLTLGLFLAFATGLLYAYSLRRVQDYKRAPHPTLIAGISLIRIFCMGLFLYCVLNSSPIHSILMIIIFGTIVWIKR